MTQVKEHRVLLPEQAAAAYDIDKHISVTAGPGSGKTMVLVERYLHILREHRLAIDQIVAITFTNRAANEMRERLRADLNHMLRIATDEERRRWLNYKRTLDGAVITTIHGFCARLLREFPIEARVDPQFLLLDEHRAIERGHRQQAQAGRDAREMRGALLPLALHDALGAERLDGLQADEALDQGRVAQRAGAIGGFRQRAQRGLSWRPSLRRVQVPFIFEVRSHLIRTR